MTPAEAIARIEHWGGQLGLADLREAASVLREREVDAIRYGKVRRMSLRQFGDIWHRALAGERFDDLVDAMQDGRGEADRGT